MSNDKLGATFHPYDDQAASAIKVAETGQRIIERLRGKLTDEPVKLDENSIADMLCDQFQCFMEEGGNDLQGEYVDEVTFGGRIVTVDWSNGQRFQVEVREIIL